MKELITDGMVTAWYIGDKTSESIYYSLKAEYGLNSYSDFIDALFNRAIEMYGK